MIGSAGSSLSTGCRRSRDRSRPPGQGTTPLGGRSPIEFSSFFQTVPLPRVAGRSSDMVITSRQAGSAPPHQFFLAAVLPVGTWKSRGGFAFAVSLGFCLGFDTGTLALFADLTPCNSRGRR